MADLADIVRLVWCSGSVMTSTRSLLVEKVDGVRGERGCADEHSLDELNCGLESWGDEVCRHTNPYRRVCQLKSLTNLERRGRSALDERYQE